MPHIEQRHGAEIRAASVLTGEQRKGVVILHVAGDEEIGPRGGGLFQKGGTGTRAHGHAPHRHAGIAHEAGNGAHSLKRQRVAQNGAELCKAHGLGQVSRAAEAAFDDGAVGRGEGSRFFQKDAVRESEQIGQPGARALGVGVQRGVARVERHIVSVFKLVQELLAPSGVKGKNQFQLLLAKLPPDHKAKWFAGAALNTSEQAMMSVISTVLSRLNAFLDSEMEQILCFDTAIDAETFCNEKSAIFIVLPEEDQTKYFMVSLILQNLYREILTVADENGGRLKCRVVFFADELGTCPPIQSLELMFSASRSRGLMLVPIVQSITGQLQKNYGKEGSEIIVGQPDGGGVV